MELMEDVDISIYTPACLTRSSETYTGEYAWTYGKFQFQTLFFQNLSHSNISEGWGDGTTTGILKEMRTQVLRKGQCNEMNDEICTLSPGHSPSGVRIQEFLK